MGMQYYGCCKCGTNVRVDTQDDVCKPCTCGSCAGVRPTETISLVIGQPITVNWWATDGTAYQAEGKIDRFVIDNPGDMLRVERVVVTIHMAGEVERMEAITIQPGVVV